MDDGSPLADLPADAVILIAGPPLTGKYRLMLQLLSQYAESVIVISTNNPSSRIYEDYLEVAPSVTEDHVGIIDCVSHHESAGEVRDTATIKYVNSPQNMTDIGVKFTELLGAFHEEEAEHIGVGLHSISQLLMYAEIKQVYRFLQVLTGQIRSAGLFGTAVIDTSAATGEQLQMLQHHFDGIVDIREDEEGGREFRLRGLSPQASAWEEF